MTISRREYLQQASPELAEIVAIAKKHAPGAKLTYFTDGKTTFGAPGPRGVVVSEAAPKPKVRG